MKNIFKKIKESEKTEKKECLHKKCTDCNGLNKKENGQICIHMISCPCEKCSFTM